MFMQEFSPVFFRLRNDMGKCFPVLIRLDTSTGFWRVKRPGGAETCVGAYDMHQLVYTVTRKSVPWLYGSKYFSNISDDMHPRIRWAWSVGTKHLQEHFPEVDKWARKHHSLTYFKAPSDEVTRFYANYYHMFNQHNPLNIRLLSQVVSCIQFYIFRDTYMNAFQERFNSDFVMTSKKALKIHQATYKSVKMGLEMSPSFWSLAMGKDATRTAIKTAVNAPGGIQPYWVAMSLIEYGRYLRAPISTRAKLAMFCVPYSCDRELDMDKFSGLIERTDEDTVRRVIGRSARGITYFRSFIWMTRVLSTILDYPTGLWPENVRLPKLARLSEEWHKQNAYDRLKTEHRDSVAAPPPIPLPEGDHIRLLQTVEEFIEEDTFMDHCVAGYFGKAKRGRSYIFHTVHNKTPVTVEVSAEQRRVVQARSVRNVHNLACEKAAEELNEWAKELPKTASIKMLHDAIDGVFNDLNDDIPF